MNVNVICRHYQKQKKFEKIEGINIHRVVAPYAFSSIRKLFEIDNQTKIDIIHSHATSGLSYTLLQKLVKKKLTNAIHITHVHGTTKGILEALPKISTDILSKKTLKKRIEERTSILRETIIWKSADAAITNSKFLKKELMNLYGLPGDRIHVVYNGVDLQIFYPRNSRETILKKHGLDPKFHVILYLGGFRPVKGPLYVLEALEKIQKEFKNVKVFFVGGKSPQEKRYINIGTKLTESLREKSAIQLIENIPHLQLPDYYSAADVVVVPSVYDAFPKVVLEAMACGTPVVAFAVGGIPELINHEKTGILVEPADPDALAKAITAIVLDSNLKNKISFNAKKLVEERFTWKHAAENTRAVYERLLKKAD